MDNKSKKIKIAIDAMGGDFAPNNEIEGVVEFFKDNGISHNVQIVFVGKQDVISDALKNYNLPKHLYSIYHTDEVVLMSDDAAVAIKQKKKSSMYEGLVLHKNSEVDAFLSAGNTGAMLSTSTVILGRVKGVSRPTIGAFFPTKKNKPVLIVDVGANVDCKPKFLFEFAVMGSIYIQNMLDINNPKVGLLNIGEEPSKGNEATLQAYELLKASKVINFGGNMEGRDIFAGDFDVVVCDGFTGNIVLKFAESFLGMMKSMISGYADKSLINKAKVGLMLPTLKDVLGQFDYQQYGGVPLLGVNGVVIIGHGSSTACAIKSMIVRAVEIVKNPVNKSIEKALQD